MAAVPLSHLGHHDVNKCHGIQCIIGLLGGQQIGYVVTLLLIPSVAMLCTKYIGKIATALNDRNSGDYTEYTKCQSCSVS